MVLNALIAFLIIFPFFFSFLVLFSSYSRNICTAMMVIDISWLTLGVVWLIKFYMSVQIGEAREIMLGKRNVILYFCLNTYNNI